MTQLTQPQAPESSSPSADATVQTRQLMSALADGETADGETADGQTADVRAHTASQWWRDDASARQAWHSYHLIGDVMRSDELASTPAHDAAFLQRLRTRLASEPVPISKPLQAPAKVPVQTSKTAPITRWLAPVAAAAGVLLVAGVVLLNRPGAWGGDAAGPAVAVAPASPLQRVGTAGQSAGAAVGVAAVGVAAVDAAAVGADAAGVIRNPQLDGRLQEYLRAHQATRGGMVAAVPGGSLRRVDAVVSVGNSQ
jgi:sigma-E factor negative regulatory protein RseA